MHIPARMSSGNPCIKSQRILHALLALALSVTVAGLYSQSASAQTVTIDSGKLSGVTSDGITAYKGIPYAAPPVGPLRWRPPQPVAKWSGVRSGKDYGHDCMQLPFPSDAAPLGTTPAEDCLVANVWTPANSGSKKLPIIFWIYGGGWVNGGSSPAVYDGTSFAKNGVIFVSFNYRVGRFGFFAHPAITKESNGGLLGNYGYMDQIAALKWAKRNASAFGGDPNNITVFGESAGGFSVHMMMTTTLTDGLFQRAIVESGGGRSGLHTPYLHDTSPGGQPSAESVGVAFAKANGIEGDGPDALAKMRALPADTVVNGLNMASMQAQAATYPGPMIDGVIVRSDPGGAYAAGMQHKLPMIIGANSMDIGFVAAKDKDGLFALFGPNADAARKLYDPNGTADFRMLALTVGGDQFMIEPARYVVRELAAAGQSVWEFRFSYVAESMRSQWPGAPHATEIPYVLDTVAARYGKDLTTGDAMAAHDANLYWVNFAKTGNPNGAGLPEWPQYKTADDIVMNFTNNGPVAEPDPRKANLDLVEQLATSPANHH